VKSSNVLLDEGLRARVADVGLALPQRFATMTARAGTFGYIDPVYFDSGECSRTRSRWNSGAGRRHRDPLEFLPPVRCLRSRWFCTHCTVC
jgi:hypothetical protein